jgi:AraC family transcriptional regulator
MVDVVDRLLDEQPALVVRGKMSTPDIPRWLGDAYHAVATAAAAGGAGLAGPPFARYRALDEDFLHFDVEAGFPVSAALESSGEVEAMMLPGGPAAVVLHIGPYEAMKPSYDTLTAWLDQHDYIPEGAPWEVYLSDANEEPDPTRWRTEIVQPYRAV